MIDLERALTDLAEHLDVRAEASWQGDLTRRLSEPVPLRRRSRIHALVAAAAVAVVVSAGVLAVAPARDAVAGWLGIGAVEIHQSAPPSTTPGSTRPPSVPVDLDTARRQVQFDITTPRDAEPPSAVTVDRRVPGGLVTLTYDDFTLVEIATDAQSPPLAKFVTGPVEDVMVHGHAGLWIREPHRIGYVDRSQKARYDTVRRSEPVLLWAVDDVTFRVEGPRTLQAAMAIAATIV